MIDRDLNPTSQPSQNSRPRSEIVNLKWNEEEKDWKIPEWKVLKDLGILRRAAVKGGKSQVSSRIDIWFVANLGWFWWQKIVIYEKEADARGKSSPKQRSSHFCNARVRRRQFLWVNERLGVAAAHSNSFSAKQSIRKIGPSSLSFNIHMKR